MCVKIVNRDEILKWWKTFARIKTTKNINENMEKGVQWCSTFAAVCISCHISNEKWQRFVLSICVKLNRQHFPRNHDSRPIKHRNLFDLFVQWTNRSGTTSVKFSYKTLKRVRLKCREWKKNDSQSDSVVSIYIWWINIIFLVWSAFFAVVY